MLRCSDDPTAVDEVVCRAQDPAAFPEQLQAKVKQGSRKRLGIYASQSAVQARAMQLWTQIDLLHVWAPIDRNVSELHQGFGWRVLVALCFCGSRISRWRRMILICLLYTSDAADDM
eukprot:1180479-Rhodomonas_salina.2